MKKMLSLLCLVGILFAFQAKLNANQDPKYPKYLVVNIVHGTYRYTDDDPDLEDDTCRTDELWLRYIPAGQFTMGSQEDEPGYIDCENLHEVELTQPFYIGVFECTQYQWAEIFDTPEEALRYPSWFGDWENEEDENWKTRPVERVSYLMIRGGNWPEDDDVIDKDSFMGILRDRTEMMFDLPTEAQWEYACRAGTTTALNSGDDLDNAEIDANMAVVGRYSGNSNYGEFNEDNPASQEWGLEMGTAKVGSYDANAWGLYDMHGNVLEWCRDWNFSNPYETGSDDDPVKDPVGESFYDSENLAETRAVRGGGWCSPASGCRSAYRGASEAHITERDHGFRIVCLTMPDPEQLHTLTVTNGTTHKANVYAGETVEIKANNPPVGKVFDKWTSEDEDVTFIDPTEATTTFDMPNHDVIVTATYKDAPKYKVDVRGGRADMDEAYPGQTVAIKANEPPDGMFFYYWQSGVTFADEYATQTTFVMPARNVIVSAVYTDVQRYKVTVVNGSADKKVAREGDEVTITADEPPAGKVFSHWTSSSGVRFKNANATQTTFDMPGNYVFVKANWKNAPKYEVTVENGIADEDEYEYAEGETVKITADNPPVGKVFDKWTSEDEDVTFEDPTSIDTTFTMPGKAVRVQATYKDAQKYSVTVVKGTADKDEYAEGKTVTIKAWTAQYDEIFDHWVCDIGGVTFEDANAMETTFFMPANDVTVRAAFKDKPKYEVTVENGTAEPSTAYSSDIITITANKPPAGKVFDCWTSEDGVTFTEADNARTTFRMLGKAVKVTATYKDARTYTVTVTNGTADPQEAYAGDTVTITANAPAEHKLFDQWTSDDVTFDEADNARTTFRMPAENVAVTANYIDEPIYTVTVRNGTANPSKAYAGQRITIKANTPSPGSVFAQWTGEGVTIRNANEVETTFIMPANDVTVTAYYQLAPKFAVTVEYGSADKTQTYEGDTVEIEAQAPAEHKLFDKWTSEDDVTFADPNVAKTTFTMLGKAVKVTATYKDEPKYTVTVENGTADKTEAYAGETVTIVAVFPSENLVFDKWTSDDVTFANANAMQTTFVMPANAVMVTAAYKTRLTYTVTVINGTANTTEAQAGDAVIITANDPAEHKLFDEWTGSTPFPNTKDAQVTFCMPPDDITVIATYKDEPKYAVTVENGTADKTEAYAGETITITANDPTEHFQFDSWTGDVEFTNADAVQTTFTMPANAVTVTAAYLEDPKYTVTVVGGKANKRTAYEGDVITITANTPASGQAFDAWSGDVDLADATATPTTFTMPGRAVSVTATFKTLPKTYKIVVVNGTADMAKAAAGEIVTLTANNPPAGKVFDRWTGGAVFDDPNSPTTTFIMPAKAVTPKALYKRK